MPHTQMLSEQFAPLSNRNKQNAFFSYLQNCYPHATRTSYGMILGEPDSAKLILSAQLSRDSSGIAALMELLSILTKPKQDAICFVFATKRVVFSGKLHIRIDDLDRGNMAVIFATAATREFYGKAVKKAFLPTGNCALYFKPAETLFVRYSKEQAEIRITSQKQRKLFVKRPASSVTPFYSDPPCVRLVCAGIARLLEAI